MLGDLARRLSLANPESDNPLLGGGIVLIDEVELHMHPSWQQTIVSVLHEVFPNIQFIITTHSPIVLGRLNADFKILKLEKMHGGDINLEEMTPAYYDTNLVLEDKMNTPSVPVEVQNILWTGIHCFIMAKPLEDSDRLIQLKKFIHRKIGKPGGFAMRIIKTIA